MANKIRLDNKVKGVNINSEIYKLSQYADDTTLFLQYDENSLRETFKILAKFQKISGLKLNSEKTQILKIGPNKESTDVLAPELQLQWTKGPITILGVQITPNLDILQQLNFEPKVKKFKQILNIWQGRDLTLMGKIQIVRSLAIPQFTIWQL